MASITFSNRFKNKIERVGKSGILKLNELNFVEKGELPLRKIHQPFRVIPNGSKILISQKLGKEELHEKSKSLEYLRSYTPNKDVKIRKSPGCVAESFMRSKYSLGIREGRVYTEQDCSKDVIISSKLPKIKSVSYNHRANSSKHRSKTRISKYY
ncbi:hypothetical protein SteCoe_4165 [Stentor coeruleus]|uniref:Uncharacterized protein n=1 Tax=Stentor coeruleus TaxID=5963 RepID=A0A1R2CVB4_9CILI|nr:hypothetical protein SteCoe_4165 [Stentor coeruleus]